ncbi:trigger factor [Sporolactobacillus spathodeae]|uniref:Trigger factor n=1 Tax=Sporolactobacillus spathodeae TaxID=1465502 RepID=A0ABS2Q8Y1_9BACL|nr:trigger factor [Sporolactobacillus spathodeae]MBM7658076.1 trigger factor [Sporolactobacillus spathodeae]
MTVQAKWEKKEGNTGTLTFEVDAETFSGALDQAFKKVVKKVNVPGFRKGRVPRGMFEQRFGVEVLYEDAIDIVLQSAYTEALDQTGVEPVDKPQVDVEEVGKNKPLVLKAEITVKPEVTLGDYKGLEVEEKSTEVTDADVDHEIKHMQERYAELVVKEDGEVANGDTTVMDFDGYVDGKPFEGGKAENYSLEIGSGSFIPGFEEQMIGMKTGDEKDVVVTFPEDYHAEELKGKEATFKVKVHEIKQKQLPELDDEFAKDVDDEVETFAALKEKVENHLKEHKEEDAKISKRDSVVAQAAANATIDIPEVMIQNEQENLVKEFEQRLKAQGMTLDMYYGFSGMDKNGLLDQMKEDAENRVRANLTLEAIAKAENIEVTEEEINEELKKMADGYKLTVEQLKSAIGGGDMIKDEITLRKTVDFLVENSKPKAEAETAGEENK